MDKQKTVIVGLGRCGCNSLDYLVKRVSGASDLALYAIDSDLETLRALDDRVEKIQAGVQIANDEGCGGNEELAEKAVRQVTEKIKSIVSTASRVVVIAGLGKGFGSGAVRVVANILQQQPVVSIFVVTLPFVIEGNPIRVKAENALKKLRSRSKNVIAIRNNVLYSGVSPATPMNEALSLVDKYLARGLMSVVNVMRLNQHETLNLEFATISQILREPNECSIGFSETVDDLDQLVQGVLNCPLSGGVEFIEKSEVALLKITAPSSTPKDVIEAIIKELELKIQNLKAHVGLSFGHENKILLDALFVRKRSGSNRTSGYGHDLLARDAELASKMGVFSDKMPGIITDKDGFSIDIPTYLRMDIDLEENI